MPLDATYRTSRYLLPLFFLVVPTNVNYTVVATFIPETETRGAIEEALNIIRSWNENWKPKYFMTGYDEQEISAIEEVFKGTYRETFENSRNFLRRRMKILKIVSIIERKNVSERLYVLKFKKMQSISRYLGFCFL